MRPVLISIVFVLVLGCRQEGIRRADAGEDDSVSPDDTGATGRPDLASAEAPRAELAPDAGAEAGLEAPRADLVPDAPAAEAPPAEAPGVDLPGPETAAACLPAYPTCPAVCTCASSCTGCNPACAACGVCC